MSKPLGIQCGPVVQEGAEEMQAINNQFNYLERGSQTYGGTARDIEAQTDPPPRYSYPYRGADRDMEV
jgi:hypothetical protein